MSTTSDLGVHGERIAAAYLTDAGLRVLDRNWRCREGELDLVVVREGAVVFCEVKTRSSLAFGSPADAVTRSKQRRLRGLAARWLAEHEVRARLIRFDVAAVLPGSVEVIEAAF